MPTDQFIEFSPVEKSNQLTKKARTTYHNLVLLLLGSRYFSSQAYCAPTGGRIPSDFVKTFDENVKGINTAVGLHRPPSRSMR
jgi:hypothetical protein